ATADSELADDRRRLLEAVVESDDDLADKFLSDSLGCSISMATDVLPALARATRRLSLTPTLCGSAKLGAGIPELLDAVLQFLPPPEAPAEAHQKQRLEALAFKTIKDPGRGPLTFFRIFSGRLQPKSSLFVRSGSGVQAAANSPHRCARVYRPFADEFTELPDGAGPGQIAAVSFGQLAGSAAGAVVTGDVVSDRPAGLVDDPGTDADVAADAAGRRRRLPLLRPPDPVVFASVEAESPAWAKPLDEALTGLALEDPGLRLRTDEETGQTVAGQRLREQLGPNAFRLGPVTVSYRERLVAMATIDSYTLRTESYGAPVEVTVSLELLPRLPADEADSAAEANSETEVVFVNSEAQNWGQLPPQALR
uniref:EFG_II domain-containing protein n=1 Tax=Macrostomum lignano TaxID=282301 RepID=A0A1I8GUE4_9PLAT